MTIVPLNEIDSKYKNSLIRLVLDVRAYLHVKAVSEIAFHQSLKACQQMQLSLNSSRYQSSIKTKSKHKVQKLLANIVGLMSGLLLLGEILTAL